MGPSPDSIITTPDAEIPLLHTESELKATEHCSSTA
jgi:hypothetical protein